MFYSVDMATALASKRAERPAYGIDRVTIVTCDLAAARALYERALPPLGFRVVFDWPEGRRVYLGLPGEPSSLWLVEGSDPGRIRIALAAPDQAAVEAFFAAALAAGATAREHPAPRPELTDRAYSAAIVDRDGNTIEAVCWHAERSELRTAERAA